MQLIKVPPIAAKGMFMVVDSYMLGVNDTVPGVRLGGAYFWLGWPKDIDLSTAEERRKVDAWMAELTLKHITTLRPRLSKDATEDLLLSIDELVSVIVAAMLLTSEKNMVGALKNNTANLNAKQAAVGWMGAMIIDGIRQACVATLQEFRKAYPAEDCEFDHPPDGAYAPVGKPEALKYIKEQRAKYGEQPLDEDFTIP